MGPYTLGCRVKCDPTPLDVRSNERHMTYKAKWEKSWWYKMPPLVQHCLNYLWDYADTGGFVNPDRIDDFNGIIRIIDYKSGNMLSSDLSLSNMDQIKDKPKSLQVLFYALLYSKKTAISNLQSGIIPLKSRSTQFLPLNYNSNLIDQNTLNDFSSSLQKIIIELMDPNIPLIE